MFAPARFSSFLARSEQQARRVFFVLEGKKDAVSDQDDRVIRMIALISWYSKRQTTVSRSSAARVPSCCSCSC
jgi:hypothetical protein